MECDKDQIDPGDELFVDLAAGVITNRTKRITIPIKPLPEVMIKILNDGGLAAHFRKYGGFNLE